jgi:hypothetical protein
MITTEWEVTMMHQEVQAIATSRGGSKLGGICSVLIGILNVLLVVYVVVTPGPQRYDVCESLRYYAENPLGLSAGWIMMSVSAVLSYAVIPIVSDLVRSVDRDWTRAATIYGIAGYTVLAASFLTLIASAPDLANAYNAGNEITRKAIVATGLPEIDPHGFLMFGGPGTWLLVVNILAMCSRRLPTLQALAGILLGLSHWATVLADVFELEALNLTAAAGGALFYPISFVWLGLRLLKASSAERSSSNQPW